MSQPNNNSVHVDHATANMSIGQVDDIKKKAMQQVTVAEQTQREAQTNVTKTSSAEGSVYGSILVAAVAPGFDSVLNLTGAIAQRREETAQSSESKNDFMQDAAKPNGFFVSTEKEPAAFDMFAANSPRAPLKVFDGGKSKKGLFDEANIAASSLKDNDPVNLKSWGIPPKKQEEVQEAKKALELTYGQKMANETAFNSALVVERQQAAMFYQARQIAPGLGMASGPTIRPDTLLSEAKSIQDSQSAA